MPPVRQWIVISSFAIVVWNSFLVVALDHYACAAQMRLCMVVVRSWFDIVVEFAVVDIAIIVRGPLDDPNGRIKASAAAALVAIRIQRCRVYRESSFRR